MQRARRFWIASFAVTALIGGFVALTACSNYDEGERCESGNGNNDCVDGLQCTPKSQLTSPFNSSDRCCPVDRSTATSAACAVPTNPIAGEAAPPDDTGPGTDSSSTDATGKETSTEAGTDAAEGG